MKSTVMVVLLWTTLLGRVCFGQKVITRTLTWHKNQPVVLKLKFGDDIHVTGWAKNKVNIKATVTINGDALDSLFSMNFDNGQEMTVTADVHHNHLRDVYMNGCEGRHRMISFNNHTVLCAEIHYEVYLPADAQLDLSSINANEIIRNMHGPVRAKSISGFVDMDWPEKRGADLALKTITGDAYSNLAGISWLNRKKGIPTVGYRLNGTISGGGPLLHLESISNNIYLRKTE